MSDLPKGWIMASLSQIVSKLVDGSHNPPSKQADGLPMLSARNISDGRIVFDEFRLIRPEDFEIEDKRTSVRPSDVLLTIVGALGRTAIVPKCTQNFTLQRSVAVVRPIDGIDANYLKYVFDAPEFQRWIVDNAKGTAQKGIYLNKLASACIQIAPINEQRRIVAKLDRLFARSRRAREELGRVPGLCDRYRQAVLAAACSGRLTANGRATHEEQVQWERVKLSEVATSRLGKMLDKVKNKGKLMPYLRNLNVRWFDFDLRDVQEIKVTAEEMETLSVQQGDVLVCEGGEPGRCAVWYGTENFYVYQKALHRVRVSERVAPEWICYCLKDASDSGRLLELFTGTTIKHLTGVSLSQFEFLLPPLNEQLETIHNVQKIFKEIYQIEQKYQKASKLLDRLEQATLAKAFRGELVPQDPNDEPAAVLLERIRAERQALPKGKAVKSRKLRS